jgi:hypothetical protein
VGEVRMDWGPDSVAVMLVIPEGIAKGWPAVPGSDVPHITLAYVGKLTDPADIADVAQIVARNIGEITAECITLGSVGYFEQPTHRVAYVSVDVPESVRAAQTRIRDALTAAGFDPPTCPDWAPHATIGTLPPGDTEWSGHVPTGSWTTWEVQVWHGGSVTEFVAWAPSHYAAEGKWVAGEDEATTRNFDARAKARVAAREAANVPVQDRQQWLPSLKPMAIVAAASLLGAPAVHTESRVHVDVVHRADRAELHPPEILASGWRQYPALFSRAEIVQVYGDVREYRSARDVFDRASMDSGWGSPLELRHSVDLLTPLTVRGVARGCVLTVEKHSDGLHTCGNIRGWDQELFDAIGDPDDPASKGWAPEVSVAYRCKVDRRGGTTDSGERFDTRQFGIVWNSLAAEPKGRAVTARILGSRLDAVTSADAMLAIAARQSAPGKPVYFDRDFVRHDSAARPTPSPRKDQLPMYDLIKTLAAAAGVTEADIATALGIAEADLATAELTPEQQTMLAGLLVKPAPVAETPPASEAPPAVAEVVAPPADVPPPASTGMVKVMIGEAEAEIPEPVAAYIASLEETVNGAMGKADRADKRSDAAESELAKKAGWVSRQDAERIGDERGSQIAEAMELTRRSRGNEYSPEQRKDAAGASVPLTLREWQIEAIRGGYGEKADAVLSRIDAASEAAQPFLIAERLHDVRERLDAAAHKSSEVIESIERMRGSGAQSRSDASAAEDQIANNKIKQAELAAGKSVAINP